MKLTSDQAYELSEQFTLFSEAIENYRYENWDDLSEEERTELERIEWSLMNASSEMVTTAIDLTLDETELSFQQLCATTQKAQDAIKKINTVRKVINIAATAVSLAGAILVNDYKAVLKDARELIKLSRNNG